MTADAATRKFGLGLARAVGGAVIFTLPLLMTMEMWWLGFYMDRFRLAILLVLSLPLLVGLSHVSGFEETFEVVHDAVDALVAVAVGFVTAAVGLGLFGVLTPGMSLDEIVGKLALLSLPGGMGALLAQSQLGGKSGDSDDGDSGGNGGTGGNDGSGGGGRGNGGGGNGGGGNDSGGGRPSGYWWQLFLMAAGALFLGFNVAPTEEMVLIAYQITTWHAIAIAVLSLAIMHAFVYSIEFHGQEDIPEGTPWWSEFLRLTVVGYALALAVSAYVLWTFGRLDGTGLQEAVTIILVLGFPAAVGAAAARLIL